MVEVRAVAGLDRSRRTAFDRETGTGVTGTAFGAIAFLAFLFLTTHTLISLYATSVLTATTWDEARRVATQGASDEIVAGSEANLKSRLKGFRSLTVDESQVDGEVVVHVSADRPHLLPAALGKHAGLDRISRTARVRIEVPQ